MFKGLSPLNLQTQIITDFGADVLPSNTSLQTRESGWLYKISTLKNKWWGAEGCGFCFCLAVASELFSSVDFITQLINRRSPEDQPLVIAPRKVDQGNKQTAVMIISLKTSNGSSKSSLINQRMRWNGCHVFPRCLICAAVPHADPPGAGALVTCWFEGHLPQWRGTEISVYSRGRAFPLSLLL